MDIMGTWASLCEAYPNGDGGMSYIDRQFTLSEDRWAIFGTVYGDENCAYALFSFFVEGEYNIEGVSETVEGASEAFFGIDRHEFIAFDQTMVETFNEAGCGEGNWMVGVAQSVRETGCIGVAPAAADCAGENDLLKLDEDGLLYFGERSVDLCNERAPAINAYPLFLLPEIIPIEVEDYYPEGIALGTGYGPAYIGSVGTGMITKVDAISAEALVEPFGLGGIVIGLHATSTDVWACVAASEDMVNFTSAIVQVNAETGEVVNRYDFLTPGFCNDLIADSQGNVYATDSATGVIYKLNAGEDVLTEWLTGYASEEVGGFSLNGIIISPDESSVMTGRFDNGELITIAVNMDGSAGEVTVSQPAGVPTAVGFDGLASWRGFVAAVFDGGVVGLQAVEGEWVAQELIPQGTLDFPTTLTIDHHGNIWVVEGQLGYFLDDDETTNATLPFGVYRFSPQMLGLVSTEE